MKNTIIALITIILLAVSSVAFAKECPICDAAFIGNLSEVKKLLNEGADVNATNNDNDWTALIGAALEGHSEITKVLLDNGANVNDKDEDGITALMRAAYKGYSEVTKVLLKCGANPDITDDYGKNTWNYAKGKRIILAILEKHLNDVVEGREFPPCDKSATH